MSDRIDKAKLKAYIAEELENVAGLKKQLTDADIEKLELEFTKTEIHQTLLEMENFAQLQKKYRSVKLTLTNWIRLKRRKEHSKKVKGFGARDSGLQASVLVRHQRDYKKTL